jgi:hypothetical protein
MFKVFFLSQILFCNQKSHENNLLEAFLEAPWTSRLARLANQAPHMRAASRPVPAAPTSSSSAISSSGPDDNHCSWCSCGLFGGHTLSRAITGASVWK